MQEYEFSPESQGYLNILLEDFLHLYGFLVDHGYFLQWKSN